VVASRGFLVLLASLASALDLNCFLRFHLEEGACYYPQPKKLKAKEQIFRCAQNDNANVFFDKKTAKNARKR